ncbi:MAG: transcription-repair coupling factor [Deltaproteobacteria bacterium]|nr:transcription-repair coupling factor [Deltaproteobacteria bacterium]
MSVLQDLVEQINSLPSLNKKITGLTASARAYVLGQLFLRLQKTFLVACPSTKEAEVLVSDLTFFLGSDADVLFFPSLDVLPYFQLNPHPDILTQRLSVLYDMTSARRPLLIVTSFSALQHRLPPKSIFQDYADYVVAKEEIDREAFLLKLSEAGYLNVPLVEDAGTFAVRGGIIDIFPPHSQYPYRLELFGDLVESIRLFEAGTQRSLKQVEDLVLLPAREVVLNEQTIARASKELRQRFDEQGIPKLERDQLLTPLKNHLPFAGLETFLPFFYDKTESLLAYLKKDALFVSCDAEMAFENLAKHAGEIQEARQNSSSPEKLVRVEELFFSQEEMLEEFKSFQQMQFETLQRSGEDLHLATLTNEALHTKILDQIQGLQRLDPLFDYFQEQKNSGKNIVFIASQESQRLRLLDLFERHELHLIPLSQNPLAWAHSSASSPHPGPLLKERGLPAAYYVTQGTLSKGFTLEGDSTLWIKDEEIFGLRQKRVKKRSEALAVFNTFEELREGDYVVHLEHGIGLYQGLKSLKLGNVEGEFLLLEYLGKDKLYIPIYRLNQIQRYTSEGGFVPQLDKLGGTGWSKAQEKAKKSIQSIAGELLKIYAARELQQRPPYLEGVEELEQFEMAFAYEETPDQEKAIQDVVRDLENDKVMDRLICGDVGFGKTEVAMRAAYKAVLNHKQVAILVPTTILAFQHYQTFQKRFAEVGATVDMLSRFRLAQEQKEIVAKLASGGLDIVIGTHRLIQRDIHFKNLGLLVIDEEQRFGVTHKERIKKMKNLVDVLTLTATPIPRTLNLSLFGIRDLSVINTPPADRLSVRTYVAHFDEGLLRDAILRELQRGGQVFFVHNRVQSIAAMADRLKKIVPEATFAVAHGAMNEEELEEAILKFYNKEAQVLLSTAIIESGVDFPSANTMIINRADCFGLSQLYQLRGRVGRSNVRAFCYLLTPAEVAITPEARSRLAVLQRFTELGSGFKVAAHDLEMRGAGNILGGEQHGHIQSIGYEMYMHLLEQTMNQLKGEAQKIEVDPELNFMMPAVVPTDYVPEDSTRLGLYKRISHLEDEKVLDELREEIRDRFGELPLSVRNLLGLIRIKIVAKRLLIESVLQEKSRVIYKFHSQSPLPPDAFLKRIKKDPKYYQLTADLKFVTPQRETSDEKILEGVYKFLLSLEEELSNAGSI